MSLTSMIRVKEKIRYDVNVHREQNKQILINSRRGIVVEDNSENDVFTIEDMQNLALEIKRRKQITVDHLRGLKHALLNGQHFISAFYHVQGAVDSLLHFTSSKNEAIQLGAIECFCNMTLGDQKTCVKLAKLVTPYLMIYINNLNFNLSSMCIWTLGNLSDSSEDSCKLLQNQNFLGALIDRLKNSTCDEVISNTFYALKLLLKTYVYHLEVKELEELINGCFERMDSWKESFWIIYQVSCRQDCTLLDDNIIKRLFQCIHTNEDFIDIKCMVPILRTFGNIIAMDISGYSANEFVTELQQEGTIIRNILMTNRQVNVNDECAWLLGNVFIALKITEINENSSLSIEDFNKICNYFLV